MATIGITFMAMIQVYWYTTIIYYNYFNVLAMICI